ncbi:hypothetical protein EON81_00170 [bacterium]|nr:MAG: hypothetical protein EON81_00170 [bacterium]
MLCPYMRKSMLSFALLAALSAGAVAQTPQEKIKTATSEADAAVAKILAVPDGQRTYENTLGPLDDIQAKLEAATSMPLFLQYVSTDAKERDNSREAEEALTNWTIEFGKREDLYRAVKAYAATNPQLEGEKKRLLEFVIRDYKRAGMDLTPEKRERLKVIEKELQKLGTDFQTNIYTDETAVFLRPAELKGLPADILKRLKAANGLVAVPMDGPTFNAAMDNVESEDARQKIWYAYKRRGGKKNVTILEKMIVLRNEQANLLGYSNTVDYEAETRMAKDSETVAKFYKDLRPLVREKAKADLAEFTAEKRRLTKNTKTGLFPWDQSYIKNQLLQSKFAVDSEKVAEYFPVQAVFDGLFQVTQSLYGIEFRERKDAKTWHPDAKLFDVFDKATSAKLGEIYTDLYPREAKYNHAACWGLVPRKVWADGTVQLPVAALVCNFTAPTADKPALMTHDEVETFFHEFGHALHNVLSEAQLARFSGTSVARDFVEAPSQMFENWIWDPTVLAKFAKHYKTNEPLPKKTLDAMRKARSLGSGLETEHQIYYGMVDQAYHTAKGGKVDTTKVGVDLLADLEQYPKPEGTWFQASFGHLVGYQGAYYGYQWSLVYAQDMFERFEKLGILNPEAGMYYRKNILAKGGTMDDAEMLKAYLGRDPRMDAYLKRLRE